MQKSITEKYFFQKRWTILEIVCLIVAVIALYVSTFVWGGGPLGFGLLAISIGAFAISKTTKISDGDIDNELNKLIRDNKISIDKKTICTYDLEMKPVVKGKDGSFRSRTYVISSFQFDDKTKITIYRIDLIDYTVKAEAYIISDNETLSLTSKKVLTPNGNKEIFHLKSECSSFSVPVRTNDVDACKIIEKVCGH